MNVLITTASRHGSTREIAEVIGGELRDSGIPTDVRDIREVDSLDGYDAFILGGGVYMGSWMSEARTFAEQHQKQLSTHPLWLFSSGPQVAEQPADVPKGVAELTETTDVRGHRKFAGKLTKDGLGFRERLMIRLVKSPEGDFRDWTAIRGWALEIAAALQTDSSQQVVTGRGEERTRSLLTADR